MDSPFATAISLIATADEALLQIIGLSLRVTLFAVGIACAIGLPLGAALALARFRGRGAVIVLFNALMGFPPVVAGLLVYLLLSRSGPLGALTLLFTPTAMVVAQTVLILPIVVSLTRSVVEDLWAEYREQLTSLGASRLRAVADTVVGRARVAFDRRSGGLWACQRRGGRSADRGRQHRRPYPHHDHGNHAGNQQRQSGAGGRARHHPDDTDANAERCCHGAAGSQCGQGRGLEVPARASILLCPPCDSPMAWLFTGRRPCPLMCDVTPDIPPPGARGWFVDGGGTVPPRKAPLFLRPLCHGAFRSTPHRARPGFLGLRADTRQGTSDRCFTPPGFAAPARWGGLAIYHTIR